MSTPSQKAKVFDQMLQYLADPLFQIPVRTFMDEKCLIFDPGMEAGQEHKGIYQQYKKLIGLLLDSFCKDAGIKLEDAIAGITKMNTVPDIRMIYQLIFEQVLAADDFDIFYQVMVKRNIMIQEQVLLMIIASTGSIPDSLLPECHGNSQKVAQAPINDEDEEKLLQEVMRKSKIEHEQHQARQKEDAELLKKTVELSREEVGFLKRERTLLEQEIQRTSQDDKTVSPPTMDLGKMTLQTKEEPKTKGDGKPVASVAATSLPPVRQQQYMTSADAAMAWIKAAKDETPSADSTTAARTAMAASLSKLSQSELEERQRYLKAQRDRLLAMKKEAREKELGQAEKNGASRPQSAQAARSAMDGAAPAEVSEEEQKKIAMRKAIAAKLRQEVIGK